MPTPRLFAIVATLLLCANPLVRADTLYSGSQNNRLVFIDTETGTSTVIGNFLSGPFVPPGAGVFAGAFSPDGTFYTVLGTYQQGNTYLATVNLTTGVATHVAQLADSGIQMLQFSPSGTLYASAGNLLYQVDVVTGGLTPIGLGFGPVLGGLMDLAMDSHGSLYGVASGFLNPPPGPNGNPGMSMPDSSFYAIDTTTGHASFLFSVPIPSIMGIAFDSQDHLLGTNYASPNSPLYQIDLVKQTAVAKFAGTGVPNLHGGDIMRTPACAAIQDELSAANALNASLTADMAEIMRIVALPPGQRRNQPNRGVTPLGRAIIDALRPGL